MEFEFAFGRVEILKGELAAADRNGPAFAEWPCPGCGRRRLLDDAWQLVVRDVPNGHLEREILVCASCANRAGLTQPANGDDAGA